MKKCYGLFAALVFVGYLAAKNEMLERVVNAFEKNNFEEFKKTIETCDQGLLMIEYDDMENSQKLFKFLGTIKNNNKFINSLFFEDIETLLLGFCKNSKDYATFNNCSDEDNNTILHYVARYMQVENVNQRVALFWMELLETLCKHTKNGSLIKNKYGKTFTHIIQERNFKPGTMSALLDIIESNEKCCLKEIIACDLQKENLRDFLDTLRNQTPETRKAICDGSEDFWGIPQEPLLHTLIMSDEVQKQNCAIQMIKEFPEIAQITNAYHENVLHILLKKSVPSGPCERIHHLGLIRSLLMHEDGVLALQENIHNQTPVDIAEKQRHPETMQLVRKIILQKNFLLKMRQLKQKRKTYSNFKHETPIEKMMPHDFSLCRYRFELKN